MTITGVLREEEEEDDEEEEEEEEPEAGHVHQAKRVEVDNDAEYVNNLRQDSEDDHSDEENDQDNEYPDLHIYQNQIPIQTVHNDQRLDLMRNLLASERRNNLQRRRNNRAMQQYLGQLQTDYLHLQQELLDALELGCCIKTQKEAQLAALSSTVAEKDRLIEQLRSTLDNLDERKLREEFKELLEKQKQLSQVEKEQLSQQVDTMQQQLVKERVNNSHILQQYHLKLEDQRVSHENETTVLRQQVSNLEEKLRITMEEPKEVVIKELREDISRLNCQLEESDLQSGESVKRYEILKKRLESLMAEQEQIEQRHNEELNKFQAEQDALRAQLTGSSMKLEDKEELIQILQFNLNRSEKRSKNLLSALKGKESAYKELIGVIKAKYEDELERSVNQFRALQVRFVELESELDNRRNELIKMELEHENQLESIRNDRDQRVQKLSLDRQKADRELQASEIKLSREIEERELYCKQVEQLQKEVNQFKAESKRLSIELTKSEAKLFSKQKELNEAMKSNRQQCLLNPSTKPLSTRTNRTVRYHSNQQARNKVTNAYAENRYQAVI